jgi:hypothetical protein
MSKKIAIYTAIFTHDQNFLYDSLKDYQYLSNDCDYYCFTNSRHIVSHLWKIVYVDLPSGFNPRFYARFIKIMPHINSFLKNYEYTIWLDGAHVIQANPVKIVNEYLDGYDLGLLPHPDRDCLYEEAYVCMDFGLDTKNKITRQIEKYRRENYPIKNGLFASYVLIRKKSDSVSNFNEYWWNEIKRHSIRDQISLPYVLWKNKVKFNIIPGHASNYDSEKVPRSSFFFSEKHVSKKYNPFILFYRISDCGNIKGKPDFVNNVHCLKNAVNIFGQENINIICDNISDGTKKWIEQDFKFNEVHYTKLGNGGSFNYALDKALEYDDSYVVYFLENDYIHRNGSFEMIYQGLEAGADYVTLYDHPDKYGAEFSGVKLRLTQFAHWRTTPSTTMTFATKIKTLREDEPILRKHTCTSYPFDNNMFLELGSKGRVLISPIPSFSTHGEGMWLAPLIDWSKYVG